MADQIVQGAFVGLKLFGSGHLQQDRPLKDLGKGGRNPQQVGGALLAIKQPFDLGQCQLLQGLVGRVVDQLLAQAISNGLDGAIPFIKKAVAAGDPGEGHQCLGETAPFNKVIGV